MTSSIGELSKLTLQDKAHNPLVAGMCDTNVSEAQRLLAQTIDAFSKNRSFTDFFTKLTPALTGSPFNINVTEEEITITDSLKAAHVLKFAEVTDSDKQGLIDESKALLEKINGLYRECRHVSGASHGSTASTAGIDPSRITPIHTHSHDPESSVAGAGAQAEPREAHDAAAQSLSPESVSDLAGIHSNLHLLQASPLSLSLPTHVSMPFTPAQSGYSQPSGQFIEETPHSADGTFSPSGPDSSGHRAFSLLHSSQGSLATPPTSSQFLLGHPQSLRTAPIMTPQHLLASVSTARPKLSFTEEDALSLEQSRLALEEQLDEMEAKYHIAPSATPLPPPEPIHTLRPSQAQPQPIATSLSPVLPKRIAAHTMTPQLVLASFSTAHPKPSLTDAQARSLEQSRLALEEQNAALKFLKFLDEMEAKYHIAPSATPLPPPEPIHTLRPSQAQPQPIATSLSPVLPKRIAAHTMTPQLVLASGSTAHPKPSLTAEESLSLEKSRLALVEQIEAMDAIYHTAPSPTQIGPLELQAELPPMGRQQPQTPAQLRTLTADPQSPVAATQQPIIARSTPLQQVTSEL